MLDSVPIAPNNEGAIYPAYKPNYLLYGRLFQDYRLEAMCIRQLSPRSLVIISGLSAWRETSNYWSNIEIQAIHNSPNVSTELLFASDNIVFGLSSLCRISKHWSLGTEAYYTHKEISGGLSFGAQYQSDRQVATISTNPIMGHIKSTFMAKLSPLLKMATSYELNVFSHESDYSLGLEFLAPTGNQIVNTSFSLAKVPCLYLGYISQV